jgi:hypothetical protein
LAGGSAWEWALGSGGAWASVALGVVSDAALAEGLGGGSVAASASGLGLVLGVGR